MSFVRWARGAADPRDPTCFPAPGLRGARRLPDRGAGRLRAGLHGQQRRDPGRAAPLLLLDRLHREPGQLRRVCPGRRPCCACSRCPAATAASPCSAPRPGRSRWSSGCAGPGRGGEPLLLSGAAAAPTASARRLADGRPFGLPHLAGARACASPSSVSAMSAPPRPACLAGPGIMCWASTSTPRRSRPGRRALARGRAAWTALVRRWRGRRAGRCGGHVDGEPDGLDLVLVCVGTPAAPTAGSTSRRCWHAPASSAGASAGDRWSTAARWCSAARCRPGRWRGRVAGAGASGGRAAWRAAREVACNPEFLREGQGGRGLPGAAQDRDRRARARHHAAAAGLYDGIAAPCSRCRSRWPRWRKLVDNSWHAVKVAFANEVGRVCAARGIGPQAVAELFLADTKLNLSAAYLRPGGPFGRALPIKDLGQAWSRWLGARGARSWPRWRQQIGAISTWLVEAVRARAAPPGPS